MQGAASAVPARSPASVELSTNALDPSTDPLAPAKGTIVATVLNVCLWVGIFGLASLLTLPR
jgi:hypothetical protein